MAVKRKVNNIHAYPCKKRRSDESYEGYVANENYGLAAAENYGLKPAVDENYGCSVTGRYADFFSRLPLDVVIYILSCLPTVYAVQTSILARDWRDRWTYVNNIDLDDKGKLRGRFRINNFITSVERVLDSSQNLPLKSFRISCKTYNANLITRWILAVLVRKVQYLVIEAKARGTIVLPSTSNWNLLTNLKLSSSCTLNVLGKACFPNLKKLYLSGRRPRGSISIHNDSPDGGRLLLIFPVLEELVLKHCKWLNAEYVELQAPELTKFMADCRFNHCEIKICAAKLETFESQGRIDNFDLYNDSSVTYATLWHRLDSKVEKLRALKILNGVPCLNRLKLSCGMIKDFANYLGVLPTFTQLKQLELFYWGMYDPEDMFKFLHLSPSLEYLILSLSYEKNFDYSKERSLPSCLASHLKEVQFTNFHQGRPAHINTVKFFLENAKNLQSVLVCVDQHQPCMKKTGTTDTLLPLLPKSSSCRIAVTEKRQAHLGLTGYV